jgi:hypothetical protein
MAKSKIPALEQPEVPGQDEASEQDSILEQPEVSGQDEASEQDSILEQPEVSGQDEDNKASAVGNLTVDFALPPGKNTLTFVAEYGDDFDGEYPMLPGSVHEVSPDTASYFVSKGFGKVIQ